MNEEWKSIEELPHYLISNMGRVRHGERDEPRQPSISDKGFPVVTLYGRDSKTRYLRQINKLVAVAFLPQPVLDIDNSIWHLDGDLTNCRADNLKWETRPRVLEWNEMHRIGMPRHVTPVVKNNRTGVLYNNAFECGMSEGMLESEIIWRIERQARHQQDDSARYRYIHHPMTEH